MRSQNKKKLIAVLGIIAFVLLAGRIHILGPILKILSRFALPLLILGVCYYWFKKNWPSLLNREGQLKKHVEKEGDRVIEICPKCGEMIVSHRHKCSET